MDEKVLVALLLTTLAGLSTGVGGAIGVFAKSTKKGFLAASLGFSAGVMIYISFVELLDVAGELLAQGYGEPAGSWIRILGFFSGVVLIALIDLLVPPQQNPHVGVLVEEMATARQALRLRRASLLTALAIGVHNFPEGIATFITALSDPALGLSIAVAIALHNIPEGIAVSVPAYHATGSRRWALGISLLSGLSEPVGALLGFLVLQPFLSDAVIGIVYAGVAGIMVFISLDQLIPNAKKYSEGHQAVYGLIVGMAVMAVTLMLV